MKNNLILIGNGFDLKCNLKSEYIDFYNYFWLERCGASKLPNTIFESICWVFTYIKKNNLNFNTWFTDFYLLILFWCSFEADKQNNRWADVEFKLEQYVLSINKEEKFDYFLDEIIKEIKGAERNAALYHKYKEICDLTSIPHYNLYKVVCKIKEDYITKQDWESYSKILLKSLFNFENLFANYISKEQAKNPGYQNNANNIYLSMLNAANNGLSNISSDNLYLIIFNYTRQVPPLSNGDVSLCWNNNHVLNIHGNCHFKIIIGIDDSKINFSNSLLSSYLFSKTYRIMNGDAGFQNFVLPSEEEELNLIFFGLSLEDGDYAYYQALFDKYDIYNNKKIKLWFFYATGHENFDRVYKLLKKYGSSLDNKMKGQNLVTILTIEQRLKIVKCD